jgi:hypothetical protein
MEVATYANRIATQVLGRPQLPGVGPGHLGDDRCLGPVLLYTESEVGN